MTDKRKIFVSCPRDENYIEIVQFFRKQKKMLSSKEGVVSVFNFPTLFKAIKAYYRRTERQKGRENGKEEW